MKEKGASNLSYMLTILVLLAGIFSASQILPFYYSYYELLGEMEAKAVNGREVSDQQIIEGVNNVIRKNNLPADIDSLKINRLDDKIIISLDYEEVFFVDFGSGYDYDLWVFKFSPRVEKNI